MKKRGLDKKSEWIYFPFSVDVQPNWVILGRVRGVDIWRCASCQLHNKCLLTLLSQISPIRYSIPKLQSYKGHFFGQIGALIESVKLDLTVSIGFIRYFLIDDKSLEALFIFGTFHCTKFTFALLQQVHISKSFCYFID